MFAVAKLAGMACRVKPEGSRQRETELGGSVTRNLRRCAGIDSKRADLNYSNRPVRTRMPGGVGGARSGILTAPIPICAVCQSLAEGVSADRRVLTATVAAFTIYTVTRGMSLSGRQHAFTVPISNQGSSDRERQVSPKPDV
jgi:hypothetical protein